MADNPDGLVSIDALRRANEAAWDEVAAKYADELAGDVERLRSGAPVLHPAEAEALAPLLATAPMIVHLQCSHGTDALALWRGGARAVVGLDVSRAMLALATRKAAILDAPARWIHADVLAPPPDLMGTADIVYTGKGALPWVLDLTRWAQVVTGLLRPGGWLVVFDGHPLTSLWDPEAPTLRLRSDADYFARAPRRNIDFPASYLADAAHAANRTPLPVFERLWTLGAIVSSVAEAGLEVRRLSEHAEHFWPQFPDVPSDQLRRVPQTFLLLAQRPLA